MDATQILKALNDATIDFNDAQIKQIYAAYKFRSDLSNRYALISYSIGDKVTFDTKQGTKIGVVERINTKSIGVLVMDKRAPFGSTTVVEIPVHWKVHPSVLKKVD